MHTIIFIDFNRNIIGSMYSEQSIKDVNELNEVLDTHRDPVGLRRIQIPQESKYFCCYPAVGNPVYVSGKSLDDTQYIVARIKNNEVQNSFVSNLPLDLKNMATDKMIIINDPFPSAYDPKMKYPLPHITIRPRSYVASSDAGEAVEVVAKFSSSPVISDLKKLRLKDKAGTLASIEHYRYLDDKWIQFVFKPVQKSAHLCAFRRTDHLLLLPT